MTQEISSIALVTDCGTQAKGRMALRLSTLFTSAYINTDFESGSPLEASGNLADALDALLPFDNDLPDGNCAVLCNSAPRQRAREQNGSRIAYGKVGRAHLIATVCTLGLLRKVYPDLTVCSIDSDAFVHAYCDSRRQRFNFRGLEVIPLLLYAISSGGNDDLLGSASTPLDSFMDFEPGVWHIDQIEGQRTNLKLTYLRDEFEGLKPSKKVRIDIYGQDGSIELPFYERLTDIPSDQIGIYESSSGLGDRRFLEIAVMGGSAAEKLGIREAGHKLSISAVH